MDTRETILVAGGYDARPADHGRLDRAEPLANPARRVKRDVMRTLRVALVGTISGESGQGQSGHYCRWASQVQATRPMSAAVLDVPCMVEPSSE